MNKTVRKWIPRLALMACLASSVYGAEGATKATLASHLLVIPMPEPSYAAILAVDLLAVGCLIVVLRRRVTGN